MRIALRSASIGVSILLCASLGAAVEPGETRRTCAGITIETVPPRPAGKARPVYSANEVLDLRFLVHFSQWVRRNPPGSLELRIFTPRGHLYQSVSVPIAAEESHESRREMKGHRHPLKVAKARRMGRDALVVEGPPLLVAGTDITQSALYGAWRVEAWPAGSSRCCQVRFTIAP